MTREYYNEDVVLRTSDTQVSSQSQLNGGQIILAQASNCGWRACYGVDPNIGRQLDQRNQQLQYDVEHARPTGQWRPDPSKLRNWNDPLDDPDGSGARALNNMRNNGIAPQVFPQRRGQGNGTGQGQPADYAAPTQARPGTAPMFQVPGRVQQPPADSYNPYLANNPYVANNPYLSAVGSPPFSGADMPAASANRNPAGIYLGPVGDRAFMPATSVYLGPVGDRPYLPPPAAGSVYQGTAGEIPTAASTAAPFVGSGGYRPFAPLDAPLDAPSVPVRARPVWLPPGTDG